MNLILDLTRSVQDNAATYYERAKELKKKKEGLEAAIEETKKEIELTKAKAEADKKKVRVTKEKKWFEKFNYFTTSSGRLAIGGRNAQQNDIVYKKYFEDADLFFHADIQGGSAVILKDGINASEEELLEVAQYTASFSNAWKNGNSAVDVYCVKKEQVSKHSHGGFIAQGAFAITGEKKWFRSTSLGLKVGVSETGINVLPIVSKVKLGKSVSLFPSKVGKTKGDLIKSLSKYFSAHPNELMEILPSGNSKVKYDN
ncbi:MAG: NFACT RNA binding domain-containing protein [Candidatus Micrarchaeota archaeon]